MSDCEKQYDWHPISDQEWSYLLFCCDPSPVPTERAALAVSLEPIRKREVFKLDDNGMGIYSYAYTECLRNYWEGRT
ncbi:MAG TPA: hypothetical protein VLH19_05580 [Patescibacteria group bacterium]|nr:hypothetical protein [Patescibacteria group bacterium]